LELTYDLDHKASFRFIERLLYHSNLFDREAQSIALTVINSDNRPFIFSTPRLKDHQSVHLPIAFDDDRIEALSDLRTHPREYGYIKNLLGIGDDEDAVFKTFLTEEAPVTTPRYDGEGVRVRYFGHACVLLETKEAAILTDPLLSYKYDSALKRYTFEDLPPVIDMVLITHAHHDHVVIETLLQLRSRIKTIVVPKSGNGSLHDPSLKLMLERIGFKNVRELEELDTLQLPGVQVTGIPFYGEHCDLDIKSKLTYLVRHEEESFLVCADSSNLNPSVYANVRKMVGPVKTLFVGMECTGAPMSWSYGSFFTRPLDRNLDQVRRSKGANCHASLALIDIFSVENVYLYAMGAEPWLNYFMALQHNHATNTDRESAELLKVCAGQHVAAESLYACKEVVF
ncbi:MAG: MBL fold metallo-hydrolase, partial [Cytophagales bacterium]|nr:MBL fold metallo-hydrolase [Cytophagales bacterium]